MLPAKVKDSALSSSKSEDGMSTQTVLSYLSTCFHPRSSFRRSPVPAFISPVRPHLADLATSWPPARSGAKSAAYHPGSGSIQKTSGTGARARGRRSCAAAHTYRALVRIVRAPAACRISSRRNPHWHFAHLLCTRQLSLAHVGNGVESFQPGFEWMPDWNLRLNSSFSFEKCLYTFMLNYPFPLEAMAQARNSL